MPTETDATLEEQRYGKLVEAYNDACANVDRRHDAIEAAKQDDETTDEQRDKLIGEFNQACEQRDQLHDKLQSKEMLKRARERHKPMKLDGRVKVTEPDIYEKGGRSFMTDLYMAVLKGDPAARQRIDTHQEHEVEKRAVTSTTLGGIIPPTYLVDLYAKASRNGRVLADRCNNQGLPDVGMSIIVPRLTTGLAAGAQATENTAVTTQDPVEGDLTVPVRTIAGYSPVSRQGIERAAYSDQILFEDLIARYWAQLDTQVINGAGTSGTMLGILATSGIASSTAGTATVVAVYPKIFDVIQQISTGVGGLGYVADTIVMHPRRWGWFCAAVDTQNRPLVVPSGPGVNVMGDGTPSGYGYVGNMAGLPVYVDANLPTNLGAGTNQDPIMVMASPVVHLFERSEDPVTLSFEQQAGTSLQVQLIVYGYAAFTAGRYPLASGAVTGVGLVPPTF
jgi:HK97 family phage major capsid protein